MNHDLNLVLKRLALLRLSIASIWLMFLGYLHVGGFTQLQPAWALLATYMPLLLISVWQSQKRNIKEWHLFCHLAFEAQLLAGLLFFTGGATNPFISYFLVLLVFSAYSLSGTLAFWITVLCIVDYSVLSQWYQPLLLATHQHDMTSRSLFSWHLAGMWLTFVISALIVTIFIPMLLKARQSQQHEIQQLREQQLKNEQLIGIATLAAGTAHEMGTPLMTMSMILDDADQQPLLAEDLEILHEQVATCRQSLQKLANAGRSVHETGNQEAHAWLSNLLHRWRLSHPNAVWRDNGISTVALLPNSPLLDQALLNLLDNAAEAGRQPIVLTTKIIDHHWQLSILQPDAAAADQLNQQRLFYSQKEDGMGIGLYLSNASVEQFGGSIHLSEATNGGSLCQLRLPLVVKKNQSSS